MARSTSGWSPRSAKVVRGFSAAASVVESVSGAGLAGVSASAGTSGWVSAGTAASVEATSVAVSMGSPASTFSELVIIQAYRGFLDAAPTRSTPGCESALGDPRLRPAHRLRRVIGDPGGAAPESHALADRLGIRGLRLRRQHHGQPE